MSAEHRAEIIRLDDDLPSAKTVQLALEEVISDLHNGKLDATKVVVLLVNDKDVTIDGEDFPAYDVQIRTGGIGVVEGISVLEICKTRFLQWMGLIPTL